MNKLVVALALLMLSGCSPKTNQPVLILGTNSAYPPYESVNENGQFIGFDIDVAQEVARKLGKQLVIKDMAFDALILALKQKKADFIMGGMSITPLRQREIAMIPYEGESTKHLTLLFWNRVPGGVKAIEELKAIGNKTIAVQVGTYMENYLAKVPGVVPKALDSAVEMIMDIKHGKSVAALVEPHIANEVMPKHSQLKRIDVPLPESDWVLGNGIGIRKDNLQLTTQVKNAIAALKNEGVIQQLEKKWFQK